MTYLQCLLLLLVALVAGCGAAPAAPATPAPTPVPALPPTSAPTAPVGDESGRLIDIGGRSLFLLCSGAGSPTVVLEAGLGGDHSAWAQVQPEVARFTRVCSYDRAGLGSSDGAPTPRTSAQVGDDLRALLDQAGEPGPYVLAGHSFGGLHARVFASRFPDDVAGLVLIDAVHEDWWTRALQALPPAASSDSQRLRGFREYLATGVSDPASNAEQIDIPAVADEARRSGSFGSLPLVVLTAAVPDVIAPGLPAEVERQLVRLLQQEFPADLAGRSTNSIQAVASGSGHAIPRQRPDLVVLAISTVVDVARAEQ